MVGEKMVQKTQKQSEKDALDAIQHVLVPKHELLSDTEKKEILERYKVSIAELPKIRVHDPAIRKMNAKHGDIIKITRKSFSAGESVFYRAVTTE